jgi:hypothetical protein
MTLEQRITTQALQSDGFTVKTSGSSVVASRGNDFRLILADGSQRRAIGAKK